MQVLTSFFCAVLPFVSALSITIAPQNILENPAISSSIPTSYESAILARRILNLTPLGTLSTVFPSANNAPSIEQRPQGVEGMPIGLVDYISDCEGTGNPSIVAITIATSFRNVAAGSNISLSVQWTPPSPPFSPASLPRFSIMGYLEKIDLHEEPGKEEQLRNCYLGYHPDSKYWLPPGGNVHKSEWVRLVVEQIYWVGGFGNTAYIGWIPVEEWKNVTKDEWEKARLPGELGKKGWMRWLRQLEL